MVVAESIDKTQVKKAVNALCKYVEGKASSSLFSDDHVISIQIGLKKIPQDAKTCRIKIPHSLYSSDSDICLITKDPQAKYKELIASKKISSVTKVMGISKLKKKYKPYEAKRQLVSSYDLFMTDQRVAAILPRLVGKTFREKKKTPIPVNLEAKNLEKEIAIARDATYLYLGKGVCSSVKIGHTGLKQKEIVENIVVGLESIIDEIPRKWKNIHSINIKTGESIALPIYNSNPYDEEA